MRPAISRVLMAGLVLVATVGCTGCSPPVRYAPLRHPFRGASLYLDPDTLAADWQHDHNADWLSPISSTPQGVWVTGAADLSHAGEAARQSRLRKELLVLVAYNIPNRDCAGAGSGAPDATAYLAWLGQLLGVLSGTRAVVVLEPDAVASDCFDAQRARILTRAVHLLTAAGQYVYLDAGHHRWRGPAEMAPRLLQAGIADAEGFSVNVSNRQSTKDSQGYALALSGLLGGREAIIDTSRNGLPAPPDDQWCNPARQALGQPSTTSPGLPAVAALLWVKNPGESDGICGTEKTDALFSPGQARALIASAAWVPAGIRTQATEARLPARG
jgi:endoglucanase